MKDYLFILDSGHGGMIGGKYMTAPSMNRQYKFPTGEIAYEGVLNRIMKAKAIKALTEAGFKTFDSCPTELDVPLTKRCEIVNSIASQYGNENCLLISLHSNAGKGTGFEIFTSPNLTKSDYFATVYFNVFKTFFPNIAMRADFSDGDPDKESEFYILLKTSCPAILPEFLFFDNWNDYVMLRNPFFQNRYAAMIVDFAKRVTTT